MHELAVTEAIVEQIAAKTAGSQVRQVDLQIGQLSGVVADSVRFCFDLVTEGTSLQGAILHIDEPGGRAACATCGSSFVLPQLILLCPCGSADVRIVDGAQLLIKSVEVV
jgi:hydrogenase nickel incorporation protein HypA/HybF